MEKINKQEIFNVYNRKNKWLGIIDYKTLVFSVIYIYLVIKIVFYFNISYTMKVYIIINFILPLLIFIMLNINEESIIDKLYIILKFFLSRKVYLNSRKNNMKRLIYKNFVKK